jgi:hypothetical protein
MASIVAVSGRLAIRTDDGTEFVAGPGDITSLPSAIGMRECRGRALAALPGGS